jgi:hypothetical protein
MCSSCEKIHLGRNTDTSLQAAKYCCTCSCGKPVPKGNLCPDCRQVEINRIEAEEKIINERFLAQEKALEESLQKAIDKEAAKELAEEISRISEDTYCAGWLSGIEFMLWDVVKLCDVVKDSRLESLYVSQDSVRKLRELNQKSGGWWYWDKFRVFVTNEEWSKILEDRSKKFCSG